jgi:hypothetical protein
MRLKIQYHHSIIELDHFTLCEYVKVLTDSNLNLDLPQL